MIGTFPRLLGDVGGTNARWAWQPEADAPLQAIDVTPCAHYDSLFDSASSYLQRNGLGKPVAACIGVATAVVGDEISFTNSSWTFSISRLKRLLQIEHCIVINDFTALALCLPVLSSKDLKSLGGRSPISNSAIALVGPGTGLGVSGLMPNGLGGYVALSGEGGHVTLSASDALEADILSALRSRFSHVSAERVLSGSGLVNLYCALCSVLGVAAKDLNPENISELAISKADPHCFQTAKVFSSFLGNTAGNLALTLGATGGVFVGGGVVPRLGNAFDSDLFRERFESKGRFYDYLKDIPCWLITAATPALIGASRALDISVHKTA